MPSSSRVYGGLCRAVERVCAQCNTFHFNCQCKCKKWMQINYVCQHFTQTVFLQSTKYAVVKHLAFAWTLYSLYVLPASARSRVGERERAREKNPVNKYSCVPLWNAYFESPPALSHLCNANTMQSRSIQLPNGSFLCHPPHIHTRLTKFSNKISCRVKRTRASRFCHTISN